MARFDLYWPHRHVADRGLAQAAKFTVNPWRPRLDRDPLLILFILHGNQKNRLAFFDGIGILFRG